MLTMLNKEEYDEILMYRALDYSWQNLANDYGISRSTLKRRIEAYEVRKSLKSVRSISETPRFDTSRFQPMTATGDMIVTCDWHIPLYDPKMVNAVLKRAGNEGIRTLIIGGDYWDMTSYSHYPPHQRESPFETERDQGCEIADVLADAFDDIYVFWGNHDFRFLRANEFRMSYVYGMQMLLQPIGAEKLAKFTFSELDYMHLEQDKTFRFSHQRNFSKIPLTVPRQLAQKYHQSIITAHSHHCAIGVALDGENVIIEGGGLFDKNITEYVQKTTTHHEWVQGYTMFKDGLPTLHSPAFGNT